LPEFNRHVLETLREPIESGKISISRAAKHVDFPAKFQFIATMNPCPCGYLGDTGKVCNCTPDQISRYRTKISGPFLDRIDLYTDIPRQKPDVFTKKENEANSAEIRGRVEAARKIQLERSGVVNARLNEKEVIKVCSLNSDEAALLHKATQTFGLSARRYHRILKVARTIADLKGKKNIGVDELTEAISYRAILPGRS